MKLDPSAFVADPELIEALEARITPVVCDADYVLFRQGEVPTGLYLLQYGSATLSMIGDKGETVSSFETTEGALLGLPGVIGNQPYTLTAIAHNGARLGYVSRDEFTALMKSEPLLALRILRVLAAEVRTAREALTHI